MHPPASPSAPGPSLVTRAARAVRAAPPLPLAPHHPSPEVDAAGARERLGRGAEVRVEVSVRGEHLVEDA